MEAPAPALPSPEDVRQLFADLANVDDADGLRRAILQLGQRQLQDRFRRVYLRATWSNNNTWLRRRLLEAAGLQAPKQAVRKSPARAYGLNAQRPRQRAHAPTPDAFLESGMGVRRTARCARARCVLHWVHMLSHGGDVGLRTDHRRLSSEHDSLDLPVRPSQRMCLVSVLSSRMPPRGDPKPAAWKSAFLESLQPSLDAHTMTLGIFRHLKRRRYNRPPKPSKLLEDAFDGSSGAGDSPRAAMARARSSGRSAPRPIPESTRLLHAASVALPLRPPSQRQLARMQSMPAGPAQRRTDAASDDEQTAFHDGVDDESGMLSAGSGLEGIDSPEALVPLCISDDESESEGEGGFGVDERCSDAVSSYAPLLLSRRSHDASSAMHSGRNIRLLPGSLRTVSASLGAAHDRGGRSLGGLWAGPCGTQDAALRHLGSQAGVGKELRTGSAPVSIETVWQAIQADDAARLGVGLGNVRITNEHPVELVGQRGLPSGWESGFCAVSPGSVGAKRKSCDLGGRPGCAAGAGSPDRARLGQQQPLSPDHAGFGTAFSPQRRAVQQLDDAMQAWKLRAVTPQLSPASVVGFSSRAGAGGQGDYASSPSGAGSYDNFEYVAPQATGHAHDAMGEDGMAAAHLHWKAQTLDDMMQSVTAAEQRMLDISSMRVG